MSDKNFNFIDKFNTEKDPDILLGEIEGDFLIKFDWEEIKETPPPSLYILNENTAFISMNKTSIHLNRDILFQQVRSIASYLLLHELCI